jgi:hypothetical protein
MDKQLLIMGAGAGTGVIVPVLMQKYVDPQFPGGIAGIKLSVIIPVATGIAGIGIGMFTNLIKNDTLNNFVIMYGFTALISGIVTFATESLRLGRYQAGNGRYMNVQNPWYVPSKIPGREGTGVGRYTSGVIIA